MTKFLLLDTSDWWYQFTVVAGSFSCQYWCNVYFCPGFCHNHYLQGSAQDVSYDLILWYVSKTIYLS